MTSRFLPYFRAYIPLLVKILSAQVKKVLLTEMTWPEVRDILKETDVAIIPVGSCEQHGHHLPLGTDHIQALERCKKIAERVGAVVAPVLYVGLSEHHMGFPGTITLSPETLVQVLFEACKSLSRHGFKKIVLFNNHGGNEVTVNFAAQKANLELDAKVLAIGLDLFYKWTSKLRPPEYIENLDIHAGFEETGVMLILAPDLVNLAASRKPKMTLPPTLEMWREKLREDPGYIKLFSFRLPPTNTLSDTGSITFLGNPKEAVDRLNEWRRLEDEMIASAVKLIAEWKNHKDSH